MGWVTDIGSALLLPLKRLQLRDRRQTIHLRFEMEIAAAETEHSLFFPGCDTPRSKVSLASAAPFSRERQRKYSYAVRVQTIEATGGKSFLQVREKVSTSNQLELQASPQSATSIFAIGRRTSSPPAKFRRNGSSAVMARHRVGSGSIHAGGRLDQNDVVRFLGGLMNFTLASRHHQRETKRRSAWWIANSRHEAYESFWAVPRRET